MPLPHPHTLLLVYLAMHSYLNDLYRKRHLLVRLNRFEKSGQEGCSRHLELHRLRVGDVDGDVAEVLVDVLAKARTDVVTRTKTENKCF